MEKHLVLEQVYFYVQVSYNLSFCGIFFHTHIYMFYCCLVLFFFTPEFSLVNFIHEGVLFCFLPETSTVAPPPALPPSWTVSRMLCIFGPHFPPFLLSCFLSEFFLSLAKYENSSQKNDGMWSTVAPP